MKYILFIILFSLFISCSPAVQKTDTSVKKPVVIDTVNVPVLELYPPLFALPRPDGRFVTETLKIKNTGKSKLIISKVEASCYCGSSTVLNSWLEPGAEGKILLNVNLGGLYGDNNIVQFTILSNAKNSPTTVNMTILPATNDSTMKK